MADEIRWANASAAGMVVVVERGAALPPAKLRIATGHGTVEVEDFTAAFTPTGADRPSVRVMRNIVVGGGVLPRYSSVAIGDALEAARSANGAKLNALQAAAVVDVLRRAVARERNDGQFESIPLYGVMPGSNGTIGLTAGDRPLWVFADGRSVDRGMAPFEPDPATGLPVMRPPPMPGRAIGTPARPPTALELMNYALIAVGESVLGLALAVLLLTAGIRVLMDSPGALAHHALYVVLKLALFAGSIAVTLSYVDATISPVGRAFGGPVYQMWRQIGFVIGIVVQVAYPIAIVCVLMSGGIRRYVAGRGWTYGVASAKAWRRFGAALDTAAGRQALALGGAGAVVVAGLHGWCAYTETPSARTPHVVALAAVGIVAMACLARRLTAKSAVAALVLLVGINARAQTKEPAPRPATRPTVVIELGPPARPAPDSSATWRGTSGKANAVPVPPPAAPPRPAGQFTTGSPEWFANLRALPTFNRAAALAQTRDLEKMTVTEAVRPTAVATVPALTEVLASRYPGRAAAMTVLEKIGPCEAVAAACTSVLIDSQQDLRPRAVALALAFDPTGADALRRLRPHATAAQTSANTRTAAARSIAALGDAGETALREMLQNPDTGVRFAAVRALAEVGPVEKRVALLEGLLDDAFFPLRQEAANALAAQGQAGRDVLIRRMFDRPECHAALSRVPGGANRAWVGSAHMLTGALRNDERAKAEVVNAIRTMESGDSIAADQAFVSLLGSDTPVIRQWAAMVIGNSDLARRAGPVTQERMRALIRGTQRFPMGGMPSFAAPAAPANAAAWVVPAASELRAISSEPSEPPATLTWWATGGFAAGMIFLLVRLAESRPPGADADAHEDADADGDRRSPQRNLAA
jgi:hypothetical protein